MAMRLHKDVQQLMSTHGYSVTFKRPQSGGSYDPSTGTVTGGTELTWAGTGVFVNFREEEVDGTSILTDDRKLLLQAVGLTRAPEVGDTIDDTVQVLNVRKLLSGSTVVAYVLQTRG